MYLLALETTCDETGAAVLEGTPGVGVPTIRSSVVSSQIDLHERFGGVVPEIAAREHVRQILPVVDEALRRAGVTLADLGAVAVATRPGLVGALIVGLTAAKSFAMALGVPLIAIDHLEGHLYACQLAHPDRDAYPAVGLVVSGGHTSLYACHGPIENELLGGTIDDAAGEAFDKVASLLGLGYPGGPGIERAAKVGNRQAFAFPRTFLKDDRLAFSFSGLKTAVLYALKGQDARSTGHSPPEGLVADIAASFQEAVIEVLVAKTAQALDRTGFRKLGIGGGVAVNSRFREVVQAMANERGVELFLPPIALCTDNAAMAGIALAKLAAGQVAPFDAEVTPGLVRPGR
jgi:N6-L-threonylcarbamoyladenine synthase